MFIDSCSNSIKYENILNKNLAGKNVIMNQFIFYLNNADPNEFILFVIK